MPLHPDGDHAGGGGGAAGGAAGGAGSNKYDLAIQQHGTCNMAKREHVRCAMSYAKSGTVVIG